MNLYDTKQICCVKCGKFVGEIKMGIQIAYIVCENCQNLELKNLHEMKTRTLKQSVIVVN